MKIVLELPDNACCVGLFINKQEENKTITTINLLVRAEDKKVVRVCDDGRVIEKGADEYAL